jgi:uncharacterized protein YbjT (DUF2867 family)
VELIAGDVRDAATVRQALQGVTTVISSFSTRILQERNVAALWKNDYEGNLSLIQHAQEAGAKKYIFISYWGLAKFGNFEHGRIKKLVEDLLSVSSLDYTIFRVTTLATDMSVLLGSRLKKKGWAPMLMKKHEKVRPILLEDLAWCVAEAIESRHASCRTIEVAGEEEYSFAELQDLFSQYLNRDVRFIFIPLPVASTIASLFDCITDNKYNAKGLVSAFTGGSTCDISEMKQIFRIQQGSFAKHLADYCRDGTIIHQEPHKIPL